MTEPMSPAGPLTLRFAHNVIEHLGLKLYQNKPTNVLAELVSNSWDALAANVHVDLLTNHHGEPEAISVFDDGIGMSKALLISNYLVVGRPKPRPNDINEKKLRYPTGRKGIGKLAPFGVARIVHVVTVQDGVTMWLRFDYETMLASEGDDISATAIYTPDIIANEVPVADLDVNAVPGMTITLGKFLKAIEKKQSGTLIFSTNLTSKRVVPAKQLRESLGRRFTVTLARPDFQVHINDITLTETDVFPEWELRIPPEGKLEHSLITPQGTKSIKYWVGFVKEATWSQEEAGVGVYAHGKIGQDRPFFFGVKGREIFSRYMYAVVEADWIDELHQDTISTDRTSVNWEDPDLESLHAWGAKSVTSWIKDYEIKRKSLSDDEDKKLIDGVLERSPNIKLRESEKTHLAALIGDVSPRLGKDQDAKTRLIEAAAKAWVHEPARKLIKELWKEVSSFESANFVGSVNKLNDELVPESLSLAVAFSLRVFALTQLHGHILRGQETQLQQLIESFPWILNNKYEKFVYRRQLATIVKDEAESIAKQNPFPPLAADRTLPDFVFFGSPENREILVVELKGPKDVAEGAEYLQLHSYVLYLSSRFQSSNVTGVLVAGSHADYVKKMKSEAISFETWDEVLLRSRRGHMDLLSALLVGTDPVPDDARIEQVCELGGKAVQDFLTQMSEREPMLRDLVSKLKPVSGTPRTSS
ncbi:ATP-binding protein [Pseudomonas syringae pv. actinidifoliorum]|nr:ATP-binding protein [Pseudomonas syringae pv. actinidifoliorum]MDU8519370.1 ATP-binding protein [Pseudomonas syringae pv. actinidifoliorum]MDU8525490.1 ATP-binding protein [Pseudomonas syringae pv. actinidifoliorum]